MKVITIILGLVAVIVLMGGVIYALIRDRIAQKKIIQELKNEIYSAHENIKQCTNIRWWQC